MNVASRIGLTVVGAVAGGFGMHELDKVATHRYERDQAQLRTDTAKATKEWTTWHSALTSQFGPDARLETPADHARFEQFLKDHPAPKWITVEHEGYTRVHTHATYLPITDQTDHSADEQGDAYAIGFGAMFAGGGAFFAGANMLKGGSAAMTLAATLGGGAAVAFGAASVKMGIDGFRRPTGLDGVEQLVREVDKGA
jgi:hypothetical protein